MSENSTPEERTEEPTGKRMGEFRKEGNLHMSTEIVQVASLFSAVMVMIFVTEWIVDDMKYFIRFCLEAIQNDAPFTRLTAFDLTAEAFLVFAPELAILSVSVSVVAILGVMLQTNWNVKKKWIEVKFSSIEPIQGAKKLLSPKNYVKTLSSIMKLFIILPVGYFALEHFAPEMVMLMHLSVEQVMQFIVDALMYVFWKVLAILILFAAFDYFYTKFQWLKQNRMTKEEVKDERKSMEGDEKTKRAIQAKGLQRIMERIQSSIPQADVVITNPTHYAIALKYDRDSMVAPTVVGKGKGFLALRIRKIAKEHGVPILERKPLARALYASTEVGTEVPRELFRAVAQVLAYVYKLKNPHGQPELTTS